MGKLDMPPASFFDLDYKTQEGNTKYLQNQHIQDFEEGHRALWRPGLVVTLVSPLNISQSWFLFQFIVGHF